MARAGMEEVGTGAAGPARRRAAGGRSAPGGPLLIVAGPGTGKTRTLTHRIAYLFGELGVPAAEHAWRITFTRRAAEELPSRLAALLGPAADGHRARSTRSACASCASRPPGSAWRGRPGRRRGRAGGGPRGGRRPGRALTATPRARTRKLLRDRRTWSTWTSCSPARWRC